MHARDDDALYMKPGNRLSIVHTACFRDIFLPFGAGLDPLLASSSAHACTALV